MSKDLETLETLFESNWDEVKGNIKSQWGKLTNQDVKHIEGSIDILVGKLKRAYGYTREEVEEELSEFLSSEGVENMKNKLKKVKEEVVEHSFSLKDTLSDYLDDYLDTIKEKTAIFEDNIIAYAKQNPMKILGTAAVLSFALSKFLGNNK